MSTQDTSGILKAIVELEKPETKKLGIFDLSKYFHDISKEIQGTDAFYLSLWDEETELLAFQYTVDGNELEKPGYRPLYESGPSTFVIRNRKSFVLTNDNRELHRSGAKFGDEERLSESAIHSPMIAINSEGSEILVGVISIQSYTPNVYNEETLGIFESLATIAGRYFLPHLERETLPELRRRNAERTSLFIEGLRDIISELNDIRGRASREGYASNQNKLDEIDKRIEICVSHCREIQQRMLSADMRISLLKTKKMASHKETLTPTEKKVVEKLEWHNNTRSLANELGKTASDVRKHISNICAKLEVSGRQGLFDLFYG
jgi:DNA-binding CsgD family transcriptional regulator